MGSGVWDYISKAGRKKEEEREGERKERREGGSLYQ